MLLQNPHFPAKFLMNKNLTERNIQGDDQDAPSLRSLKGWYHQMDGTEPSRQGIYKRPRVFRDRDLDFTLRLFLSSKLFTNLTRWKKRKTHRAASGKPTAAAQCGLAALSQNKAQTGRCVDIRFLQMYPLLKEAVMRRLSLPSLHSVFMWNPFHVAHDFQQNTRSIPHPLFSQARNTSFNLCKRKRLPNYFQKIASKICVF